MYFFKSVLDVADADPQEGQIVVRNITGRPFRVGTPGYLCQPNGIAIVDSKDPIVQHNLQLKRIALISDVKPSSSPAAPKKSKKKKADQAVEAERQDASGQQDVAEEVKVDEVAVSEPAAEPAPVEVAEVAAETSVAAEQSELAPNADESSL